MISLGGYTFFIWFIFGCGWLGAIIIAVAALREVGKLWTMPKKKD